jgi:hypothetical protein
MNNIPYVYKLTHTPSLKWYVGSRTAKKCHPQDGYMGSSKVVSQLVKSNPSEWEKTIVATGSKEEMLELETEILQTLDAKNDKRSFNQHNNDGLPMPLVSEPWNKGKKTAKWSEERKLQRSLSMTGKTSNAKGSKWSDESKKLRSEVGNDAHIGMKRSDETKQKQSEARVKIEAEKKMKKQGEAS